MSSTKTVTHPRQKSWFWWIIGITLIVWIGVAYQRALLVGFLSDDHLFVAFAQISPLDGSVFAVNPIRWLLFHRPFVLLIWQLMYRLWGLNPLPYHLLSLILHALNSFLIVRLVYLIAPDNPQPAIGAGLIFALLPLHVETVVWLACWFDLFALTFYLSTLICLIHAWQQWRIRWYLLSVGMYQIALWSKESAFTLPAMVLVVGVFISPRPPIRWLFASVIPYSLILALNLLQRYLTWGSIGGYAHAPTNMLTFAWDYLIGLLGTVMAPLNRSVIPLEIVQSVGLLTALIILIGLILGVQRRLVLFGLIWFGMTLMPVFNLLPLGPDLQNARLIYPVIVGYSIVLAAVLTGLTTLIIHRYRTGIQIMIVSFIGLTSLIAIRLQVEPWIVATRATEMITTQLQQALPPVRPGTILQVSGAPDNYRGAYIYRIGIDVALLTREQQLYIHWPEFHAGPIPYQALNLTGDFFQAQIRSNEQQQLWEVAKVRGVTVDAPLEPVPPTHWIYGMQGQSLVEQITRRPLIERPIVQQWNPGNCQEVQHWQVENLSLDCRPGTGVVITPENSDPMLFMPGVRIQSEHWTEVVVTLEALAPTSQAAVQIYWGTEADGLDESRSVTIELPDTPRLQHYHFFIPPRQDGATINALRIDPINQPVPIRLTDVRVQQDY